MVLGYLRISVSSGTLGSPAWGMKTLGYWSNLNVWGQQICRVSGHPFSMGGVIRVSVDIRFLGHSASRWVRCLGGCECTP